MTTPQWASLVLAVIGLLIAGLVAYFKGMQALTDKINALGDRMAAGDAALGERINALGDRMVASDAALGERINQLAIQVARLEERTTAGFAAVERRLDGIETRLTRVETRLGPTAA